jgi:hypothetical protein
MVKILQLILRIIAGITIIIIVFNSNGCEDILKLNVSGDGNIITDTLRWRSNYIINELELSYNFRLEIYKSEIPALHVQADSNLMVYIKTDYAQNKLTITRQFDYNLNPSRNIIVRLYINNLSTINVIDGGNVVCDTLSAKKSLIDEKRSFTLTVYEKSTFKSNYIETDNLNCITSGGSVIDLKGEFNMINYSQTGSGETFLRGTSELTNLKLNGSGKIEALNFYSKFADINLRNSGLIYCSVSDFLSVDLKGTGRIYYRGNPDLNAGNISIYGGGDV